MNPGQLLELFIAGDKPACAAESMGQVFNIHCDEY